MSGRARMSISSLAMRSSWHRSTSGLSKDPRNGIRLNNAIRSESFRRRNLNFQSLNYLAVTAAAVSVFVIGGLWYSPVLLGAAWKKANGFEANPPTAGPKVFALALVLSMVMAVNLAMFLSGPTTTTAFGAMAGFLAGFGWAAMGIGIVSLFEKRS